MAKFLILSACLALSSAAPQWNLGAAPGLAGAPLAAAPFAAAALGPVQVHERVHAGPAVAQHRTITGVVGHRQIQVGSQTVQVGHQYALSGETSQPRPAFQVIAKPATNTVNTLPLAVPPPPAAAPAAALPPPARNLGPAPLDAVTTVAVQAPVRTHTRITPRLHRIEPQLQVNQVPYDVPVAVPVPVERIVVQTQHVPQPYEVAVPRAVPVPQPYKVHPVHRVVETPIVHQKTVSVEQPIIHTAVRQFATVAHAPAAIAAAPVGFAAAPLAGRIGIAGAHGLPAGIAGLPAGIAGYPAGLGGFPAGLVGAPAAAIQA